MNYIGAIFLFIGFFICSTSQADVQSYFNQIKNNPNALYEFLKKMPKGGELHYHLAGGPYPEEMLAIAAQDNYCLDKKTFVLSKTSAPCAAGERTATLLQQPEFYEKTIKSWSMKDFFPGSESGHDHFFNTFFKFTPLIFDHRPELVVKVIQRAAAQQEHYLELMVMPDNGQSMAFGNLLHHLSSWSKKRAFLLGRADFQKNIQTTVNESERILAQAQSHMGCDTMPQNPNCRVTIKFLYYSLREQHLDNLFAQTLNAFEAVARSQKKNGALIGVNLVQAEDGPVSLRDYYQQMLIYQYLHQLYPQVNIALHAGELTQELVAPKDLAFHIHNALFIGQAQRIGHGVDIAHEDQTQAILDKMSSQHKAVEINLTSSQRILNVSGKKHPLNYYLAHHVPVVLSTDDEGILRTDLTSQYVLAVREHGVDYETLKQINRNALIYAFLPGKSIWDITTNHLQAGCHDLESISCKGFLKNNPKAQVQWELEKELQRFEKSY